MVVEISSAGLFEVEGSPGCMSVRAFLAGLLGNAGSAEVGSSASTSVNSWSIKSVTKKKYIIITSKPLWIFSMNI